MLETMWAVNNTCRTTPLKYTSSMFTFIESSIFEREVQICLDNDEYAALQAFLVVNPETGNLIPGSGGVRKLIWKRPGRGKRGGVRVIYYV